MKNGSFTGIYGFPNQDMACQETMGPIVDRSQRAPRDVGRRDHPDAPAHARGGARPSKPTARIVGRDPAIPYDRVRSEQKIIPIDQPWQPVGAYAGEQVPVDNNTRLRF